MRKFVRKKEKTTDGAAQSDFVPEPSTSGLAEKTDREEAKKLRDLETENLKLKEATQRLLNENIDLKQKAVGKHRPTAKEPGWQESKKLVEMVTQENDFLLSHIRSEHSHIRQLKSAHLDEIREVSENLDSCQLEKKLLEEKLTQLRVEHDRMNSQLELLSQDMQSSVPIEDHHSALNGCQSALTELRESYTKQLHSLYDSTQNTQSEMRRIALEMAKVEAELTESQKRNKILLEEKEKLKEANASLQAQLLAAHEAKEEAENTLRQLLSVTESLGNEKEKLLADNQTLRNKLRQKRVH